MADLHDVREAMAAKLRELPGVQASAYNPSNPTLPCLFVLGHDEIDYGNMAFGRRDTGWNLVVRGYVSKNFDRASQEKLDSWLASDGDSSVRAKLEEDQTLGGLTDWILVKRSSGSNIFKLPNQIEALGTNFTVEVQTSD